MRSSSFAVFSGIEKKIEHNSNIFYERLKIKYSQNWIFMRK